MYIHKGQGFVCDHIVTIKTSSSLRSKFLKKECKASTLSFALLQARPASTTNENNGSKGGASWRQRIILLIDQQNRE